MVMERDECMKRIVLDWYLHVTVRVKPLRQSCTQSVQLVNHETILEVLHDPEHENEIPDKVINVRNLGIADGDNKAYI